MSLFFAENNNETSKELFDKRLIYRASILRRRYNNVVDFNFGEKFLYGRVSRRFVPIVFQEGFMVGFKPINKKFLNSDTTKAVNFVADAFNAMAQQFTKCAMGGRIDPNDPFLSNIKVYKAYQDPFLQYSGHNATYFNAIKSEAVTSNLKVRDFKEFTAEFLLMMERAAKNIPFTYPAFVKSRFCPITCSGLAIEIADLDSANDEEKIKAFITSKNWEFYINACNQYGFMVDLNVPWRIVADIDSTGMHAYASQYGLNNTDEILTFGFKGAAIGYYENFKYDLLRLYNHIKVKEFTITENCHNQIITKLIKSQNYTPERLFKEFSDEYFLKLYFKLRIIEEESSFEAPEQNDLIDDCIELFYEQGVGVAINNFEIILNKPFDYRGSLSYINTALKARE